MSDIFFGIIFCGFVLSLFSFSIAFYMNIWIYYSEDKNKYPYFPFLNPFSFSSFELMFNSMFKIIWDVEHENKKLKLQSNKLRKFSGFMILISIITTIMNLIFT